MKVCQYLTNTHPLYTKMVSNSIYMLRKYNNSIKVRLYLVQDYGTITKTTNHRGEFLDAKHGDYIEKIRDLNVEIIEKEPIDKEFFHIHRSLFSEISEESVLFIDADTYIFKDVEYLFEKYKEYDYVGLPIYYLDGWNKEWLPFKPFNSAVNLWNNGWISKFANELPYWCELIKNRNHIVSDWCYKQCYRCTNREEISTSLFVNKHMLNHTVWDRNDVINSATSNDYIVAPNSCIFHTFTHNWQKARGLYLGKKFRMKLINEKTR